MEGKKERKNIPFINFISTVILILGFSLFTGCTSNPVVDTIKKQASEEIYQIKQETITTMHNMKNQATNVIQKITPKKDQESKKHIQTGVMCLRSKGLTMYGSIQTCIFSKQQQEKLGDVFKEFQYVDCEKHIEICQKEGVTRMPLWKVADGKSIQAVLSLDGLLKNFDCE